MDDIFLLFSFPFRFLVLSLWREGKYLDLFGNEGLLFLSISHVHNKSSSISFGSKIGSKVLNLTDSVSSLRQTFTGSGNGRLIDRESIKVLCELDLLFLYEVDLCLSLFY